MAKMGRPKAKDPRSQKLDIRLTEQEYTDLELCVKKHGLTKTQAVVRGIQYLKDLDKID